MPFTVHVTFAFDVPVTTAVKLALCPADTVATVGESDTTMGALFRMVIVAEAVCAPATAVRVTGSVDGTAVGAAYMAELVPVGITVPTMELPPVIPSTLHVIVVPGTMHSDAVKFWVVPAVTFADEGTREFAVPQEIVTFAAAAFDGSATLVATTDIEAGDGGIAGAVYVASFGPVTASVPTLPFPLALLTLQLTLELADPSPVIVAVKRAVPPGARLAEFGAMLTTMPLSMVTVAEPLACGADCVVAVMVILEGEGIVCGAV